MKNLFFILWFLSFLNAFSLLDSYKIANKELASMSILDDNLYLVSFDGFIYKFSLKNYKLARKKNLNSKWLRDIKIKDNYLYIASNGGEIFKIDENLNIKLRKKIHKNWITKILIDNNNIISLSYDAKIKKSSLDKFKLLKENTLKTYSAKPFSIIDINNTYVVGLNYSSLESYDKDLNFIKKIQIDKKTENIRALAFDKDSIFAGLSKSLIIKLLNKKEIKLNDKEAINKLLFDKDILYICTSKGKLYLIKKDIILKKFKNEYGIRDIKIYKNLIIIADDGGYLRIINK